ncbi:MAG: choline/carnitine O-acyltransferase, partial [Defluviitaleaceae bacterium]|nr:choline/carnitine O-acyltransferase [Defluviitaleaceae bacterium]
MANNYERPALLPLPDLGQTVQGYLDRVRPLVTLAEYGVAAQTAKAFASGGGKQLQSLLEKFGEGSGDSWLTAMWLDKYLAYRGELSINMNYLTTMDTSKLSRRGSLAEFAAAIVHSFAKVYVQYATGSLPQEAGRSGPLCMGQ